MSNAISTKRDFSKIIEFGGMKYKIWSLKDAGKYFSIHISKLPYSTRVLFESQIRASSQGKVSFNKLKRIASSIQAQESITVSYYPHRIIVQDYTGVPALVDLAALRDAVKELEGDPDFINPVVQTDIIVDHSIQVDESGNNNAFLFNTLREYERNEERYTLLKWAEHEFKNVRVFPPGSGIIHQINLEYLSNPVIVKKDVEIPEIIPDSVIGTDSHTTMVNSLGILGWGVGGLEAEAVMLGYPLNFPIPKVVGVELTGHLMEGVTTTDLVLTLTKKLREVGVVNQFVEFYGEGIKQLTTSERAIISNMAPEFGATCAFFPVDEQTMDYFRETGRDEQIIQLAENYFKTQGLFYQDGAEVPAYHRVIPFNLTTVNPSVSGPSRPQDRISISELKNVFKHELTNTYHINPNDKSIEMNIKQKPNLSHGSIAIAAITSCTNTSNPALMIAAGLIARNAFLEGLEVPSYVKCSFSPGSRVVTDYLDSAGLSQYLEKIGFYLTGYGCMTCSGSSGPLELSVEEAIKDNNLIVASILSGNRNFEGRIHPLVKANFLASPPLVVAYALYGRIDINLDEEPIGIGREGKAIYLKDIWPSSDEINRIMKKEIVPELYINRYKSDQIIDGRWSQVKQVEGKLFSWNDDSTYIKRPTYIGKQKDVLSTIQGGRVLAILEDNISTDHISPGGMIGLDTPAGKYLTSYGVSPKKFNTYGSRRGNHEVIVRGTFGNLRLKNKMVSEIEGGFTVHQPSKKVMTIFEAAEKYQLDQIPLIILAGKEYGVGSSRDSAAKGTSLLGVRAVIAESFERIHRSNLINMGVLPLQFQTGEGWRQLSLDGSETYSFTIPDEISNKQSIKITATKDSGNETTFYVMPLLETEEEVENYKNGGILQTVIKKVIKRR